jgi:hypothetical protein
MAKGLWDDYSNGNGIKYNLATNNCMQLSIEILMEGTFANNNSSYKLASARSSGLIIPNWAYYSMRHFDKYIDSYNKKSEWDKFWTKKSENPWLYFDYFSGNDYKW